MFANEIFRYSETKTSTESRDTPHPLIQTFSIPEIIATVKDSPTEIFGTVRDFRRKILILPPPFYPNFFDTRNYCNTIGFPPPYGNFRHCETKNFRGKILTLPPPSYPNFFDTRNYCNTRRFPPPPTEIFGTVRRKIFDGKS